MQRTLLVITGPTASGKTSLAIDLARKYNTEVISADSRQFYKGLDIGTAKPTKEELDAVKHHFINNCQVGDYYSAGDFERDALTTINSLFAEGKELVVAAGGSGLYIKALCEGLDDMPKADLVLRKHLTLEYQTKGIGFLQNELKNVDPKRFETIDQNNPQRLMRAIEMALQNENSEENIQLTNEPNNETVRIEEYKTKDPNRNFRIIKIGIDLPRELLYERINKRVDEMMEAGLLREARRFYPYREMNALQTVGYSELFDYIEGKTSLERAVELIKQHTRNYAKRQMTWLRANPEIHWISPDNQQAVLTLLAQNVSSN